MTKKEKVNYSEWLSIAITQLEKDSYWTKEVETEHEEENNIAGFKPIMALKKLRNSLLK